MPYKNAVFIRIYTDHPKYMRQVPEHILVAEKVLNRYLEYPECVHHHDSNQSNNKNSNLVICMDDNYHKLLHYRTNVLKAGGDPNIHLLCSKCDQVKLKSEFHIRSDRPLGRTSNCQSCRRLSRWIKIGAKQEANG